MFVFSCVCMCKCLSGISFTVQYLMGPPGSCINIALGANIRDQAAELASNFQRQLGQLCPGYSQARAAWS